MVAEKLPSSTYHRQHSAIAVIVAGPESEAPLFCVIDDNDIIFPERSSRNVPARSSVSGSEFHSSDDHMGLFVLLEPANASAN